MLNGQWGVNTLHFSSKSPSLFLVGLFASFLLRTVHHLSFSLSFIFFPHCGVLLSNSGLFNLTTGCVQGGQIPRPDGGEERHGDAHPLQEAAFNQENLCLLPCSHCQILVQYGMENIRANTHTCTHTRIQSYLTIYYGCLSGWDLEMVLPPRGSLLTQFVFALKR